MWPWGSAGGCEMGLTLGKLRRRSSTPVVVPGAAPALAKAGVGGFRVKTFATDRGPPTLAMSIASRK